MAADDKGLNPFMNQVYFYAAGAAVEKVAAKIGLNPFMNQVYFYRNNRTTKRGKACVLIPL